MPLTKPPVRSPRSRPDPSMADLARHPATQGSPAADSKDTPSNGPRGMYLQSSSLRDG